jgi:hypothetical protein
MDSRYVRSQRRCTGKPTTRAFEAPACVHRENGRDRLVIHRNVVQNHHDPWRATRVRHKQGAQWWLMQQIKGEICFLAS